MLFWVSRLALRGGLGMLTQEIKPLTRQSSHHVSTFELVKTNSIKTSYEDLEPDMPVLCNCWQE